MSTPYAKALVRIAGGATQSGGITVAASQSVALQGENTTGWRVAQWQIIGPPGWAAPAGWTDVDGVATYTGTTENPPSWTLPTTADWGKWAVTLTVNGGEKDGDAAHPEMVDTTLMLSLASANGLVDLAVGEAAQFDELRGWSAPIQTALRAVDDALGLLSGTAELVTLVGTGSGGGDFLVGDVVCSANDAIDKTKVKLATAANLLAAGGAVKGVMLETGAAGTSKQAAGDGDTVDASVLGFTLTGDGEGTGVVLNTATGRAIRAKYPADSQTPLGAADAQGNTKLSFVAPGVMSRLDNLSFVSVLDYGASPAGTADVSAAHDLAHADAIASGCKLLYGAGTYKLSASRTVTVPIEIIGVLDGPSDLAVAKVWQVAAPSTYVDETTDANSTSNADFTPFPTAEVVGDYCAFGYSTTFARLTFDYLNGTAGIGGYVVWEYWNGTVWAPLAEVDDTTQSFCAAAADARSVTWCMPANWAASVINGSASLYFARARVVQAYSTNPVLDQAFVGSAVTLTIASSLEARRKKIFGDNLNVAFTNDGAISEFHPQWWGVKFDNATDSTFAARRWLQGVPQGSDSVLPPGIAKFAGFPLGICDDSANGLKRGLCITGAGGGTNPNSGTYLYWTPTEPSTVAGTYVSHGNGGTGQQMQRWGGFTGLTRNHVGRVCDVFNNAQPGPYVCAEVHSPTEASFFHPGLQTAVDDTAHSGHIRARFQLPMLDVRARGVTLEYINLAMAPSTRGGQLLAVRNPSGIGGTGGGAFVNGITLRSLRFLIADSVATCKDTVTWGFPYVPDTTSTYAATNTNGVPRVADSATNGNGNVSESTIEDCYWAVGSGWTSLFKHGSPSGQSVDVKLHRPLMLPVIGAYINPARMNGLGQANITEGQFGDAEDWVVRTYGGNRPRIFDKCYQEVGGKFLNDGAGGSIPQSDIIQNSYLSFATPHPSLAVCQILHQGPLVIRGGYLGVNTDKPWNAAWLYGGLANEPTRFTLDGVALALPTTKVVGSMATHNGQTRGWPRVLCGNEELDVEESPNQTGSGAAVAKLWQVAAGGPTFVDETTDANSAGTNDTTLFPVGEAINDYVAFGFATRFNGVVFDYASGVAGVGGVVAWEFWNGASWSAFTNVNDLTAGFTAPVANGLEVRWKMPAGNWAATQLNSTPFGQVWQVAAGGPTFVDETADASSAGTADFTPFPVAEAIGDYCAFGFSAPFASLIFDYAGGTAGVAGTVAWEYWNGSTWVAIPGLTDNTAGFTSAVGNTKTVTFIAPGDWAASVINGSASLYYVRARCTKVYTTNPVLDRAYVGLFYARAKVTTTYSTNPVVDRVYIQHRRTFTFTATDLANAGANSYPFPAFGLGEVHLAGIAKTIRDLASRSGWNITSWIDNDQQQIFVADTLQAAGSRLKVTNITRGETAIAHVWQVDADAGPAYVNETADANSTTNADFTPFPATEAVGDWCAFGFASTFCRLLFDYANGTAGIGGTVVWEYWDGAAWQLLPGISDGTTSFTAAVGDGKSVTWNMPANWAATIINGSASLYFVRARVTVTYSTNPVLDQAYIGKRDLLPLLGDYIAMAGTMSGSAASQLNTDSQGIIEAKSAPATTLVDSVVTCISNHAKNLVPDPVYFPSIMGKRYEASGANHSIQDRVIHGIVQPVGGTFTMDAAATKVISNARITATSVVRLTPTNLAAMALYASKGFGADLAANVAGTSFTVKTGDATAAAGTETFHYEIIEP